jgi:hypothetical protein
MIFETSSGWKYLLSQAYQQNLYTLLEQMLSLPKDRPPSQEQTNVIYRINCTNCLWSYIVETG